MTDAEALRKVKQVEAEVRALKEKAARDAGEILREAERKATALVEQAKKDAEAAYQEGIQSALDDVQRERNKILKRGQEDADALKAKATGADLQKAADLVIKNLESRIAGK